MPMRLIAGEVSHRGNETRRDFSGNGADGASPSKMALGRHRRVGKIIFLEGNLAVN